MLHRPVLALSALSAAPARFGLNLVGALAAADFDRTQPSGRRLREIAPRCGTVVVVGNGGREFWQRMTLDGGASNGASRGAGKPPFVGHRMIDDRCAQASAEVRALLAQHDVAAQPITPRQHPQVNFAQLAEMAGLGVVSPVSDWLLNPHYGPWLSVRFALLLDGMPWGDLATQGMASEYQPCSTCDQPCVRACQGQACCAGTLDRHRCATWYHGGGCGSGCDMKRACPVGAEHRFGAAEERYRHAEELADMQKEFGLGVWRFVPTGLRGRPRSPS
jgi:hypothetical protein